MNKLDIKLSVDEVNLILESLGHLPYLRVYELVTNIQGQAREQLEASQNGAAPVKQQEVKNGAAAN
jgi:hypothetical protein